MEQSDIQLSQNHLILMKESNYVPYISNISNSSPTPNTYGDRVVNSLFAELDPLAENLYSQIAVGLAPATMVAMSLVSLL